MDFSHDDDQKYQLVKSGNKDIHLAFHSVDPNDIAKDGDNLFKPQSNCGKKAVFSFQFQTEVDYLQRSASSLIELLKKPKTLPFCLNIMRMQRMDEIRCNDTTYRILDICYEPKDDQRGMPSLLKLVCQVKKESSKKNDQLVTLICNVELFVRAPADNSAELAIHDANKMPSTAVFFLVAMTKCFLEHFDLFQPSSEQSDYFEPTLLIPVLRKQNANYQSRIKKLAVDLIKDATCSNNSQSEKDGAVYSLLRIGITPGSIQNMENRLLKDQNFDEQPIDIYIMETRENLINIRTIKGKFGRH